MNWVGAVSACLMIILAVYFYIKVVRWAGAYRWKFWLEGDLKKAFLVTVVSFIFVAIMRELWKWEVKALSE